ncbi:uncharacterized protein LOC107874080 [Capsicum annuum]|uniref:uncharacterized protein LOC107874080 n=1 Tax=Capsicum annuum TaxID=4072 RepID=UPI001FB0F45E|nr:uncharacterized protein LOC107874080 [Capsicum annuum]
MLNVWMYECCSEVDSAIAERVKNVIPRIFNWKVVGIKVKYEKFMGEIAAGRSGKRLVVDIQSQSDHDIQGFEDFSIILPTEILKKTGLFFDALASQHTKRRRTVRFDSATIEEQVYQKTPSSVSTRTVPIQKTPSFDSERAEKTTPSSSSKSICQDNSDEKWNEIKLFFSVDTKFNFLHDLMVKQHQESNEKMDKQHAELIQMLKHNNQINEKDQKVGKEKTGNVSSKDDVEDIEIFKTPQEKEKKIAGETVKSIDIDSADDSMDGHYFNWNRSPIQEQSEDVEGCCEDIATVRLDALVKFVVNQNSTNPNVGTPSTVHINKDHMDVEGVRADIAPTTLEYLVAVVENLKLDSANVGTSTMQTLSESAQVELDAILEGVAAPVDDLPIEVVPPSEAIVNKHDISDSQLPPDFPDAVAEAHQAAKILAKRIRTRSKNIDVIFYHLRKKSKLRNDQDYRFTTTNYFFKNYIVKTYSNYYEDDTDTIITTQQDYAQSVDVVLNEDAITNIIKGYCMPSDLPWHQIDEGLWRFVAEYAEYLREGMNVPSDDFEAEYHRIRCAILFRKYGIQKA